MQVDILEDSGEERLRGLQVERDPHESEERPHEAGLHSGEGHDRARGDRDIVEEQPGGAEVDHRRDDREEDLHHGEEPLTAHLLAHLQADLVVILVAVACDLCTLLVETLGQ